MKIAIFDSETTGLPAKHFTYEKDYMNYPYLLSMAWKCLLDGQESPTFEYIINQEGRQVPSEATAINGITQAMCDDSKFDTFTTLIQFMMDIDQADVIIGWNLFFDTSLIKANILRIIAGGKTPIAMYEKFTDLLHKDKRIDLMRVCHKVMGGKWPKLTEAYRYFFNETFDAHTASGDVEAVLRIFKFLLNNRLIVLPTKAVVGVEEE
jgi:DNA polymerase-3 subunit alpha